jgi:hypothetical protein
MNGEVCCILGVCCPPGSEAQANALAKEMASDLGIPVTTAKVYADWCLKHFDLGPKGKVAPLLRAGAKLVGPASVHEE